MIARATSIVEGKNRCRCLFSLLHVSDVPKVPCQNEVRRFIQQNTNPACCNLFIHERTKADELFIRMEALSTIVARKSLLAREKQDGPHNRYRFGFFHKLKLL